MIHIDIVYSFSIGEYRRVFHCLHRVSAVAWKLPLLCSLLVLLLAGGAVVYVDQTNSGDCGPGSHVEEASTPPGGNTTVSYAALTESQQAAFHDALTCNVRFGPESKWLNGSRYYSSTDQQPFDANEYVRYDGTLYEIVSSRGEHFAVYGISASPGTPPEGASVTALPNLSSRVRTEVRQALASGHYSAPPGKWASLPDPLHSSTYVRHDNQTFELTYVVGDGRLDVVTVDRID